MWREILSWGFGFLTPAAIGTCGAMGIGGIVGWFELPQVFKWVNLDQAWAGGFLFVAVAILGGIVMWRVVG